MITFSDFDQALPIVNFTITAEFSSAHWLIFIVNKRTDAWIYNLCDASTSESGQFVIVKNELTSVLHASVLLLTMNFVITLSK